MSNTYHEPESKKSARFSSVNQIFNYTAEKTEDEGDSLLLTPKEFKSREHDNLLSQKRSKSKEANAARREHKELQMKRKSLAEKKENFKKRLSLFPANRQEINQNKNNQKTEANQERQVQNKPNLAILVEQKRQTKQLENKQKMLQKQPNNSEGLNSTEQKTKTAANSQPVQNNHQIKMDIEQNNQISTQNIKSIKNLNKNSRITMDYRSVLMELGIVNQNNEQKNSQQNELNKSNPNEPPNLVTKAIRRLSQEGRKVSMKKNNRVTLNFNQIHSVLTQYEPNDTLIKSLRKESDQRQNAQAKQKAKLGKKALRQFLQKFFSQEQYRRDSVRQNIQKLIFQRQCFLSNIKKLDELQNQFDEQIRQKKMEQNEQIRKIDLLQRNRYNPQQVQELLTPIQLLQRIYSVNIVQIMSRSQSSLSQSRNYQIKFIIDEFLYCKIISNEHQNISLVIPVPIDFEHRTVNWSLDLKLRLQLMKKYFQKNLCDCDPIPTVMHLGIFWQNLQKIESDFQMIDQLFEILELNLDQSKDMLLLRIQMTYDVVIDVRVNFMKVGKQGYFQIDNRKEVLMSKRKVELLQFMTEYVVNLKF